VIDDEERVGQAFAVWLDGYRVETATSGEEGLEMIDSGVDVVLLDRHMPGLSGSEVLERIREASYGCQVAMVTAVDPDFDIVDMPFDDYVSKPVDRETLQDVIERLLSVDQYDQRMAELYAIDRTIATLETDGLTAELEADDRYHELLDRKADLEAELRDLIESFDAAEMGRLFDAAIHDGDTSN
jgi:DNA-binding response OmpR family regulator